MSETLDEQRDFHTVCVFCGSNQGASDAYRDRTIELGTLIARRGLRLVYGGAKVGLMGALADAALGAGGEVVGVMPRHLVDREVAHEGLSELRIVQSMHERKALMSELGSGFVALPGGLGTLEELFEIWTWGQLGLHRKPYALMNVEGLFDPLIAFLDRLVSEGFVKPAHREMLVVDTDAARLLDRLAHHQVPVVAKWIDPATS